VWAGVGVWVGYGCGIGCEEELWRFGGAGGIEAVDRMEGECLTCGICFRGVGGVCMLCWV
jgi:hypothetical protein